MKTMASRKMQSPEMTTEASKNMNESQSRLERWGSMFRSTRVSRVAAFLFAAVAVTAPGLLHAQGESPPAEAPADFRGKVTLAYGIVFGCVVIYLILSMRRNAGMAEEVAFLEKRLDELQNR